MNKSRKILQPAALLLALMLAFTVWFSAYSIRLHDAHLTHKSDLGQMDLAIWNTAHGRFLQEMRGDRVSTRLTDHFEPIFLPVSLVFWLWDDVRALLVLQAAALASAAWPLFLLARHKLRACGLNKGTEWAALVLGVAYLLVPALQAAAVAEFHALPLAPPLIAWALWATERRQWGRFVLAAALLMAVQEGTALLGAMVGVYAAWVAVRRTGADATSDRHSTASARWPGVLVGLLVFLGGLVWFYVATFVIIPPHAALAHGLDQTPYAARYGALGASFGDVLKALVTRPGLVWRIAIEPMRLRYLFGLLAPTGFLALLGPEILVLAAPLLLANLLSAFPFQYAGELHYSAPLVPYVVAAAALGMARLLRLTRSGQRGRSGGHRITSLHLALALVMVGAMGWQIAAGYTPLGRAFWRAGGWPQVTAHDRLLACFAAQIPADAALSVTTDLYPHLSHRELVYEFPWLGEATWALVDVSGTTDRHPADVRAEIERLMTAGWGVVDAADGYILLARGQGAGTIPDAFYDFARAPAAVPEHQLDIMFGNAVKLVGYDIIDDPRWRRTTLRYYWQALAPLPADTSIAVQVLAPDGAVADDTGLRPMPALIWYPPQRWAVGETVVTESLGWYLPTVWAPAVGVYARGAPLAPRFDPLAGGLAITPAGQVRLPAWERRQGRLIPFTGPRQQMATDARFADGDWAVTLASWSAPSAAAPGGDLAVDLQWRSDGPAPRDYTVFLHLLGEDGRTVATGDATPSWFTPLPASEWARAADDTFTTWDEHVLSLPAELLPGRYLLVVGWYYWETGERLPAVDLAGNPLGDEVVLGSVTVDATAALRPDLACLLIPEACASQNFRFSIFDF